MSVSLSLSRTLAGLFPADTLLIPRGTAASTRWIMYEAYRLESATGIFLALMGEMPLVCHRNVATPLILDFFRQAGMPVADRLDTYASEAEAAAIVGAHVRHGGKLAFLYPPPRAWDVDNDLLIPLSLYHWLNDKANLTRLVPARYTAANRLLPPDRAGQILDCLPGRAVFVKACREAVSGGGGDVYYCPEMADRQAALEWLGTRGAQLTGVRVEQAIDIRTCWCVNLAVSATAVTSLGAASQIFSAPARQCGSRIDPANSPPPHVIGIARAIAARARALGYRGIAGFDIGVSHDGLPFVFDLNFRFAACTPQVMLHEAAVRRVGASTSQSWHVLLDSPLEPALDRLAGFARRGAFLPTRLYEATPASDEKSLVTGFIVGNSPAALEATETALLDALAGLPVETTRVSGGSLSFRPPPGGEHRRQA